MDFSPRTTTELRWPPSVLITSPAAAAVWFTDRSAAQRPQKILQEKRQPYVAPYSPGKQLIELLTNSRWPFITFIARNHKYSGGLSNP